MSLSKRLSDLMILRGISAAGLATAVGKSRQSVSYWMAGRNEPSPETLTKVAEVLGTTPLWLKAGDESHLSGPFTKSHGDEAQDGYIRVPVYDACAGCGAQIAPPDDISSGFLDVAIWFLKGLPGVSAISHINIVPSSGDSMEPTIASNAFCFVDRNQNELRREGIYCLRTDDLLLIKRVQRNLDGTITLLSDNTKYPPQKITQDILERTTIIGRVVYTFNGFGL